MNQSRSIADISPCVPARVRVHITGVLDLAHGGPATADTAAHVDAAAAAVHDVDGEGCGKGGEAEPEEGAGGLCLAAILLGVGRGVTDAVGGGVGLGVC